MQLRSAILTALFVMLAAMSQAQAVEEFTYGKDAYTIVIGGRAPNKRLALATHGEGKGGHDNFHVYLMAEPSHRPVATLPNIGSDNNYDTDPEVYYAAWSPDSHYVAVSFRSDRQLWRLHLYAIEGRRARQIAVPDLFREAIGRTVEPKPGGEMQENFFSVEWRSPRRFRLDDFRVFIRDDTALADKLGDLGWLTKTKDDRYRIEFAARANVTLGRGDRYRLGPLREGAFRR